jgi:hypothetical protein
MAHSLISTGLLEVISNRHAGNAKRLGKPPFLYVHIFPMDVKSGAACGIANGRATAERVHRRTRSQTSTRALPPRVMYCHAGAAEREAQAT